MAERRMFAKSIVTSDAFLEMPVSARCLYFHLCMNADNKGRLNCPKALARSIGADESDYLELLNRQYLMPDDESVVVITHWREHNGIGVNSKKRQNYSYRQWRKKVLERDCYRCTKCGATNNLNVHHIKRFADYPSERLNVSNGLTLCESCHRDFHRSEKRNGNV